MSYFFSGYRADTKTINNIKASYLEIVPNEIKKDIQCITGATSFLTTYGSDKVISDIILQDEKTRSWLAILGTPLIKITTENEKLAFINRLFSNPKSTLDADLDGCFVVLGHDASRDTFYVITDYDNTIPLYYAETANGVYFSSHELPLARALQPEIDPLGFSLTIQLKLTWGTTTRFKGIQKLLPCQIVTFNGIGRRNSERYWSPLYETQWPSNFNGVIDKWLILLKDSVQAFYDCAKNKTFICDFTAGEDSRLLLSQCHSIGIPFYAMVDGLDSDVDVLVAREAAQKVGFDLVVRPKPLITEGQLLENAISISLMNDAYEDYFQSCTAYAVNLANPPKNYEYVKLCGAPGGEVFRGSYYLRGKAFFPSRRNHFDHRFFTRMKYLLDYNPRLMSYPNEECKKTIFSLVEEALQDVTEFPVGIKIDHLLRVFQACNTGLIYKNPRYLPFATKHMTRSIYNIPPDFKRGGRLTKACTEILYPELAFIKTQKGVPTVRKTLLRTFLFMPEYLNTAKSIIRGASGRLYKFTETNKAALQWSKHATAIMTLFNNPPYKNWFSSSKSMITGHLYKKDVVDALLAEAKSGSSKQLATLGRIINQELACRWVYRENRP